MNIVTSNLPSRVVIGALGGPTPGCLGAPIAMGAGR